MVTIEDPDGFLVNVVYGQERRKDTPTAPTEKLRANYPSEKQRVRQFNRFAPGPAAVHKVSLLPFYCLTCLSPYTNHFSCYC